jgi:hypothetical protein
MKIKVLLILSLLSIWLLPIQLFATQQVSGNYEILSDVNLTYNSGGNQTTWNTYRNSGFLFFTDGWGVLNWGDIDSLGLGLIPNGNYTFHSTNSRYSLLQIGSLELDIYQFSYSFDFTKTNQDIEIEFTTTNDPKFIQTIYTIESVDDEYLYYMYIRILDNTYAIDNVTNSFNQGFREGYFDGVEYGTSYFGYLSDGVYLTATQWGVNQYNLGLAQGPENTLAIRNMIPGILGVTFAFFFQLASVSFLGISALDLLGAVITIATSIFIIRIFLNR